MPNFSDLRLLNPSMGSHKKHILTITPPVGVRKQNPYYRVS